MQRPYLFAVHFDEGTVGRAWLNDLPLHKQITRGPDTLSGGANHLLVPGTNTISFEIMRLRDRGRVPPVDFKIYQVLDPNTQPISIDPLTSFSLPAALSLAPGEEPTIPLYYTSTFIVPEPLSEPVYFQSPPTFFPCEGTPELRQVVIELHEALSTRDLATWLELLRPKHEEFARAYPAEPTAAFDRQRAASETFFSLRPVPRPLDFSRLHFEPRAGGRVAYVSGLDNEPALVAAAEDQPNLALRANLLLTQIDGRWRVFG